MRGLFRWFGRWFDPRTRRPLVVLVVVAMGVVLGPLAADYASVWFFAIPWRVRWAMGQGALVAGLAAGVGRLCIVRPSDRWLQGIGAEETDPVAARWMPWALRGAVASLAIPILAHPDGLGFADWDFVLDKFEAVRRTILLWGQFPWWNPWCRGGFPLAAEPQIGAVSIATPLVLALGAPIGLRIAAILGVWIAVEGAYRLARAWLGDPWASAAAALIYGLNGAVAVGLAVGYIIAMSYGSLPWMAYHASRIGERRAHGLWLGFWTAFTLLNGLQYISLYAIVLASAFWIRALRLQPSGTRIVLLRNTIAALGVFLAMSGWRLATVYPVLLDDRREAITLWDESILAIGRFLLDRPGTDWPEVSGRHWDWYVSVTSYVGPVVVVLASLSLRRGWRWWHTLVVVCGWLAIGSHWWYHASYWLSSWPFIGSAHVVTRWRFVAMLGLGLAAGSVLARWRAGGNRLLRGLAIAATLAIASDYLELAWEQLPLAFSVPPEPRWFPGPPAGEIVNVGDGMGYPCVVRGYGVIRGYEPMLSYHRDAPTLRKARGEPGYRGEAWTEEGEIRPVSWSPNRIAFRVRPGQEVFINQNPGSWWRVNGRRAFPGMRCAEPMQPFAATADPDGRIVLRIDPPGLRTGLALHILGTGLLAAAALAIDRRRDGTPE